MHLRSVASRRGVLLDFFLSEDKATKMSYIEESISVQFKDQIIIRHDSELF